MNLRLWAIVIGALGLFACQSVPEAENVAALQISFVWATEHRCSTSPPAFEITGVPEGTTELRFKMTDLNVPAYQHGGGSIAYSGGSEVPAGAFSYKGPCPPSGAHMYEFDVKALNAGGEIVAKGTAKRPFPP